MAKYRSLTIEELESMEKEFVDFLVLNGITGGDWKKIKETTPERAAGICEAFSDVVFTKILKQCRYIEQHLNKLLISIYCDDDKMHLLGLELPLGSNLDFTREEDFQIFQSNPPEGIKMLDSSKSFSKEREVEIWEHLQKGFFISNPQLYLTLFSLVKKEEK